MIFRWLISKTRMYMPVHLRWGLGEKNFEKLRRATLFTQKIVGFCQKEEKQSEKPKIQQKLARRFIRQTNRWSSPEALAMMAGRANAGGDFRGPGIEVESVLVGVGLDMVKDQK